jgi:hypothetical protein
MSGFSVNVHAINLVCRTRKAESEDKLRTLLGIVELDMASKEYFQKHRAVAKIILDRLMVAEREELDAKIARIWNKGYDKETQRQ